MLLRATLLATLAALALTPAPASAQAPAVAQGPTIGQLEIRAYQPIPKVKTAVQLSSDTHLSRELRRLVMIRIARRGNDVGFSGGNVMRMDVSFRDFGLEPPSGPPTSRTYDSATPRAEPPRPSAPTIPRSTQPVPPGTTLRITLTLYSLDGGRVLWQATAACRTGDAQALRTGELMIEAIFEDADRSRIADAGCPL